MNMLLCLSVQRCSQEGEACEAGQAIGKGAGEGVVLQRPAGMRLEGNSSAACQGDGANSPSRRRYERIMDVVLMCLVNWTLYPLRLFK